MRRTVVLLPGLFSSEQSVLRQPLPALQTLAELGEMRRVRPLPPMETLEAAWLGLKPDEAQLRQGPLTVAALGADPPDKSTHFHLSLLGLVDGLVVQPPPVVQAEELRQVLDQAKRLDTAILTLVTGEHLDHGLVWEGRGDLHTVGPQEALGQPVRSNLPEGDAERILRRFIDDSVNLLSELELNERRLDEGLPPLNLLWPWGHGVRRPVPNLVVRRGERAQVESGSLRLAGLARLAGYRHGDRAAFGRGVGIRLERLAQTALAEPVSILVVESPLHLREEGKLEELEWLAKQLDERLVRPLHDAALRDRARLAILAPGGLGLSFETGMARSNVYPFDERALEERALPEIDAWDAVEEALRPLPVLRPQEAQAAERHAQ